VTSEQRFPGWRVITGGFIVLTTSSGLGFYGLAVYLNAISKERGWDVSAISLATTVFFLVGGISGVVIARLIARFDVRYVMVAGGLLGGGMLALLGQVTQQWQLFVVYALYAAGWAGGGLVPVTTVVTRWYQRRRSVALSITSTGLSVGGVVLTPLAKEVLDSQGMRAGTPWLGVLYVLGTVPFAWFLVRPDPRPLGWEPDGERIVAGAASPTTRGVEYALAIRTRFFRAVTVGYVLALGPQVGAIQQLVKLTDERVGARSASFAISVVAATSVVARLIGGRTVTRFPLLQVTVCLSAVQAVSMVGIAFADGTVALFAMIVVFGATIGNILMLQPLLIAERFGVRDYPRIFSRTQLVTVVGTAGGPLLLGLLRDHAGGYRTSYLAAAACSIIGAVVLASGGPAEIDHDHVPMERVVLP
jgi:MFS family permease